MTPKISVVLPIYNAAPYLQAALDSLYSQTLPDFEIIAINDGSTDDTQAILASQTDKRLRCLSNNSNRGLIFTLNRGLNDARGRYIARFDADDLCRPERFALQASFLDNHPDCDLVASFIEMFDSNGKTYDAWQEDRSTTSCQSIKALLPKSNCIAHPSIMLRKELVGKYYYRKINLNPRYFAEDYELWLRLAADGKKIEKIPEILVDYRIHDNSSSKSCDNPKLAPRFLNPEFWFEFKNVTTKLIFFAGQLRRGRCRRFEIETLCHALREAAWKIGSKLKHSILKK